MSGEKAPSVMGVYGWVAAWNLNRAGPLFGAGGRKESRGVQLIFRVIDDSISPEEAPPSQPLPQLLFEVALAAAHFSSV